MVHRWALYIPLLGISNFISGKLKLGPVVALNKSEGRCYHFGYLTNVTRNHFQTNSRNEFDDTIIQLPLPRGFPSVSLNFILVQELEN